MNENWTRDQGRPISHIYDVMYDKMDVIRGSDSNQGPTYDAIFLFLLCRLSGQKF